MRRDVQHRGIVQNASCVPLPWWTSKSTMATRSMPCASRAYAAAIAAVLKMAEAHRLHWRGVVARRPHEAIRRSCVSLHDRVDRVERPTNDMRRNIVRAGSDECVGVGPAAACFGRAVDCGDVPRVVDKRDLVRRGCARFDRVESGEQPDASAATWSPSCGCRSRDARRCRVRGRWGRRRSRRSSCGAAYHRRIGPECSFSGQPYVQRISPVRTVADRAMLDRRQLAASRPKVGSSTADHRLGAMNQTRVLPLTSSRTRARSNAEAPPSDPLASNVWRHIGTAPRTIAESGLPLTLLEDLVLKVLRIRERPTFTEITRVLCLHPLLSQDIIDGLVRRKLTAGRVR